MHTARSVWRSLFAATLVLALFAGLAPAPSSAQSGMATLTIHSRFCPPNYAGSDLFGDCHDNPGIQGIQFGISSTTGRSGSGTPDTEGNLTFYNLPAGDYRVTSTVPTSKQLAPAVYCSPGDGSTATHFPSSNDYQSESTISIAAGQSLICDWYTIPTADFNTTHSNLTIHNRFCPIGYSGGNHFVDCHDNVGIALVSFTMQGPETASAMIDVGDATFTWLTPGDYNLSSDGSLQNTSGRLICSAFDHAGSPFLDVALANDGPVGLEMNPGRSIVCDWFVVPTPAFYQTLGNVTVVTARCETSRTISLASGIVPGDCVLLTGIPVSVYPYMTGDGPFGDSCTTGSGGTCTIQVRHQVPLNAIVGSGYIPAGYELASNPFYVPPQYTEFAQVTVIFTPIG